MIPPAESLKSIRKKSLVPWVASQSRPSFERETYEKKNRLLPELAIFGWLRFHETLQGALQPDRHPEVFEVHYLKRGHLRWWVEDQAYDFQPGSVFIVHPNELHGGDESSLQPCEHFWLRFNPGEMGKFLASLPEKERDHLRDGFDDMSHRTFPVSAEIGSDFERLLDAHRSGAAGAAIIARGVLHAMLATIIRDYHSFKDRSQPRPLVTWRIRRILTILDNDTNSYNSSVAELADMVGLSESGFRERFKAETGYSPHEYILDRRISDARRRLAETDEDITRIAMELGFASSQYFATVFRKRVGLTPSDFRHSHTKNGTVEAKPRR